MKTWLVFGLVLVLASAAVLPAAGQGFALQIADTAAPVRQGLVRATAGIAMAEEANFYGVRGAYGVLEGLSVFADLGLVDPDDLDTSFGVQGGAMYTLPVSLPVPIDVAVRGTVYKPFIEDLDVLGFTAGGVASYDMAEMLKGLAAYAALGFDYVRWSIDIPDWMDVDDSDSEVQLGAAAGAIFAANDQVSFYVELGYTIGDHFDGATVGAGGRVSF